ncbi:hypothetical protein H100_03306, partial [Trichophyton rubrum MR850]
RDTKGKVDNLRSKIPLCTVRWVCISLLEDSISYHAIDGRILKSLPVIRIEENNSWGHSRPGSLRTRLNDLSLCNSNGFAQDRKAVLPLYKGMSDTPCGVLC